MKNHLKELLNYNNNIERITDKERKKNGFQKIKKTCIEYFLKIVNQTFARIIFFRKIN